MSLYTHKFKVGDRVCRIKDDIERHGTVVAVNVGHKDYIGQFFILYSVQWDDTGLVERGYLDIANGLVREKTELDR